MFGVKTWVTYFPLTRESMHVFVDFVLMKMDVHLINMKMMDIQTIETYLA